MKKNILLVLLLATQITFGTTLEDPISGYTFRKMRLSSYKEFCDACGCAASGGSMGFSALMNPNFIGVRYFYQSYSSRDGIFDNSPWIKEHFNTLQIWSKIPVTQRLQVAVLLPYQFHNREKITGVEAIKGLGDITVTGLYTAYQTHKDSTILVHKLQLGGGIKMPTGAFNESNNAGNINQSFQVGTGSWDFLLVTEYILKKGNLGMHTMGNYIFKTENRKQYQFGNQFNYGTTFFYLFNTTALQLIPQIGIAGEVYQTNKQYGMMLPNTAGSVLFSKMGFELGKGSFSLGANAMLPIQQHLANAKMEANYRWSIHLNYSL